MKLLFIACALTLMGSCSDLSDTQKIENIKESIVFDDRDTILKYANTITAEELTNHVYTLASSDFEGRETGAQGFDKASKFLKDFYISNLSPLQKCPKNIRETSNHAE